MKLSRFRFAPGALLCVTAVLASTTASAGAVHLAGGGGLAPAIRVLDADEQPEPDVELEIVFAVAQAPEVPGDVDADVDADLDADADVAPDEVDVIDADVEADADEVDVIDAEPIEVHRAEQQTKLLLDTVGSVTVVTLDDLTERHVLDADVLVISAATDSAALKPYLLKANVPIVAMKPANWNALGLTPPNDDGSTPLQRVNRVSIESAHTIAIDAGPAVELFADDTFWPVGQGWELVDAPTGDAAPTVVATGSGGAALIAFDAGDRLGWAYRDPTDRAPACRVAFPAHGSSNALLTAEGLDLLRASVEWAGSADCRPDRSVPATPSLDDSMCRTDPADESRRASNGELVDRADNEEPNLSALWVRALVFADVDTVPTMFVGGRFSTAYDAAAERDDDGELQGGVDRAGVFGCDLTTGRVTDLDVAITIDSMTAVGNGVSNERVRALAYDGTWLYVGGKFALDTDALEGVDLGGFPVTPTLSLIRVDPITGEIDTSWRPDLRGSVSALAIDGDWIYASGGIRQADGEPATRLVRLDIGDGTDGRADPDFRPRIEATMPVGEGDPFASVLSLEVADGTLYFGGSFQLVDGEPRNSIAAIDLTTDELTPFAPSLGDNNYGVDEIAQIKDIVADGAGSVFACGDWWLTAQAPGQTWVAFDVDNDADDPNDPSWYGQRSRVQPRPNQFNVGKFDANSGASVVDADGVPWGPVTDGGIQACDYDPITDTLILGGHYERIGAYDQAFIDAGGPADDDEYPAGHVAYEKVTAVDGTTGAVLDWDPDVDSIRGLDAVAIIPGVDGATSEIIVGGAITESDRTDRESLARYVWRR